MTCRYDRESKAHLTREHRPECVARTCHGCAARPSVHATMSEAARSANSRRPLTRSTSTRPKEGLAMKATRTVTCPDCGITHHMNTRRCRTCYMASRPKCSIPGCNRPRKAIAPTGEPVCGMHRERLRTNGTLDAKLTMGQPEKRFWAKVKKTETCWLWAGWINGNGYGQFSVNGGEKWAAHRWAYVQYVGPIPDGHEVDHVYARGCRHRHCVNPAHLEAVAPDENKRRIPAERRRNQWTGAAK